jgi:hypothetical protein
MSSLTETAYYTRRAINWTILGIIAYFILRFSWTIFVALWLTVFPPHAPPPNHAFGKLPAIKFPPVATPSGTLTFQLETIQGTVPQASPSAAVYFMPKSSPNLLGLSNTQEFAKKLQFDPTPIQESKNIYRFNDPEEPLRRMRYDIVSKNFIIRYAFERDAAVFIEKNFTSSESIQQEALDMLESYSLYPDDLDEGPVTISYLRLLGNQLVPTTSLSQSDAVRVDFFRKAIGGSPVITPSADEAHVSIIFSGSRGSKKRLLQFAYTYWPIDYTTNATYALKSSTQAWEELQQGKGYILRYPKNSSTAVVRNAHLAYYDSFDPQTYLQPVFVFEGDNGFLAYVPAVTAEWTE